MKLRLNAEQSLLVKFWLPASLNGLLVWLILLFVGSTPIIRSTGLALVIVGVTLSLRRMGSVLSMVGGLTLAFSPVFWSQTGGGEGEPATIVIALAVASVAVLVAVVITKQYYMGFGLGIIIFSGIFISQVGNPHSIRLTAFVIGWVIFLLVDMLLLTNPRPEDAPLILYSGNLVAKDGARRAQPYHIFGLMILLGVGILNDPLLVLLFPSFILSLYLTHTPLPKWYWILVGLFLIIGVRGIVVDYLQNQSHLVSIEQWRYAVRWINMTKLIITQFSPIGILLSVLGLARLSRWYPSLGVVSLAGYIAYWSFGLVYFGPRRDVLLLPLFAIHVVWMTYAALAFSEWVGRLAQPYPSLGRYCAIVLYGLIPLVMFINIWQTTYMSTP